MSPPEVARRREGGILKTLAVGRDGKELAKVVAGMLGLPAKEMLKVESGVAHCSFAIFMQTWACMLLC